MMQKSLLFALLGLALLCGLCLQFGCSKKDEPDPETAKMIMSTRTLGLAFLEENRLEEAEASFKKLIELAPKEAMGYANLGLVYLRQGRYAEAEVRLEKAIELAPRDPDIRLIYAELLDVTDRRERALAVLEKSIATSPDHVRTLYALAEHYRNAGSSDARQRAEQYLSRLVALKGANLAARVQLVETLLKNDKVDSALVQMEEIRRQMPELPRESRRFYDRAIQAMQQGDGQAAYTATVIFHNFLKLTPLYQAGIQELKGPGGAIAGSPVLTFSRDITLRPGTESAILEALRFTEATGPAGLDLFPAREPPPDPIATPGTIIAVADFDRDGQQDVYMAGLDTQGEPLRYLLKNEIGLFSDMTASSGVDHPGRDRDALFVDFDNDGFLDLFVANATGHALYRNVDIGKFANMAPSAGINSRDRTARALFVDLDHDGDLDLYLANDGPDRFYRNNLDGSFTEQTEATGLAGPATLTRDAAFADFDDDGDIDLLAVDVRGNLRLYSNLRQGRFADAAAEIGLGEAGPATTVAVSDYDNDGFLDLFVALRQGGGVMYRRLSEGKFQIDSRSSEIMSHLDDFMVLAATFFDFDNDGLVDLLAAGIPLQTGAQVRAIRLLRNEAEGRFSDRTDLLPEKIRSGQHLALLDYNEDGDLDILLSDIDGTVHLLRNDGGNANKYLKVKLVGIRAGSGKNNYFGIGAKVEMRAGDLYQMRVVTTPMTHFGMGQRLKADVVRILWPNGTPQNLFYPGSDQDLVEEQTLKGSCAFLYTWNGEQFEFFTDIMWRSALGMPLGIMGGEAAFAAPISCNEFERIPGEKLQPKDGRYVLQITEELWETAYIDKIALVAVDHPDSIDIYVNESFTPPPFPAHRLYQAGTKRLPKRATDDRGNDLLPRLRARDFQFVDNLTPARYQGITELHDLVLEFDPLPADSTPVYLFLQGWIFPSDASINVAVAQAGDIEVVPPLIEVADSNGAWQRIDAVAGFPMGKNKTVIVELTGRLVAPDYRLRLRTNMQIYWDHVFYTVGNPQADVRQTTLQSAAADLHYRGFSRLYRKGGRNGPHWFDYQDVSTEPRWRDLIGYYTRYGDVRELLLESDDRYVIVNAGDEITVDFDAAQLPPLPPGWKRDFLIYSDGWIKDGDLNTAHGKTVEPLPFHGLRAYPYGPDDRYPAERLNGYLKKYNIRYVGTDRFRRLLSEGALQPPNR